MTVFCCTASKQVLNLGQCYVLLYLTVIVTSMEHYPVVFLISCLLFHLLFWGLDFHLCCGCLIYLDFPDPSSCWVLVCLYFKTHFCCVQLWFCVGICPLEMPLIISDLVLLLYFSLLQFRKHQRRITVFFTAKVRRMGKMQASSPVWSSMRLCQFYMMSLFTVRNNVRY